MKKIILFGASGNLGQQVAKELVKNNYDLTLVVRSRSKAASLSVLSGKYIIADVCKKDSLKGICDNQDIVVSAVGKSVSPTDNGKETFRQVDLEGNSNILEQAKISGVKKFVYFSAFCSEDYPHLEYFRAHHEFSLLLIRSGIDYSIIKPPALYSAFKELILLARKGRLVTIGNGDKRTNPIFEGDLAKISVSAIEEKNKIIEAGGNCIYTRRQLQEIIQRIVNDKKRIKTVPVWSIKSALPIIRLFDRNMFDKFSFFLAVMSQDTIAPMVGKSSFPDYIKEHSK